MVCEYTIASELASWAVLWPTYVITYQSFSDLFARSGTHASKPFRLVKQAAALPWFRPVGLLWPAPGARLGRGGLSMGADGMGHGLVAVTAR